MLLPWGDNRQMKESKRKGPEGFGADLTLMVPEEMINFGGSASGLTVASINLGNAQSKVSAAPKRRNGLSHAPAGPRRAAKLGSAGAGLPHTSVISL